MADPQLPQEDVVDGRIFVWPCEHGAFCTPDRDAYGRCRACGTAAGEYVPASQVAALRDEVERLRRDAESVTYRLGEQYREACRERDEARADAERWERGAGKLAESNADFKAEVERLRADWAAAFGDAPPASDQLRAEAVEQERRRIQDALDEMVPPARDGSSHSVGRWAGWNELMVELAAVLEEEERDDA